MLYKAFISYSHESDTRLATALHSALHRFTKPWYKLRALNVFRDQVNLSATPSLWNTIQAALNNSEYFIILASTRAAKSKWVAKEVEYWCANKNPNKILIVLTEGEIKWDDGGDRKPDFDWLHTTALPKSLSGKFEQEPLWVNLTWVKSDEQMSIRHLKFRDQIATLASPLHGRSKDTRGTYLAAIGSTAVSFIGETDRLAAYNGSTLLIWDAPGKSSHVYPMYDPLGPQSEGTFSHDGKTLAVQRDGGNLELWTVDLNPHKVKQLSSSLLMLTGDLLPKPLVGMAS